MKPITSFDGEEAGGTGRPVAELVAELRQLKVRLFEENGQLRYQAPKGVLSAEQLAEMRARKAELLEFCRQAKALDAELALRPVPRDQELPIALAQQRLWLIDQIEGPSAAYNIALALRLRGRLDVAAWQAALAAILQRHETLRTAFVGADGTVRQAIAPTVALPWTFTDLSGQPDALAEATRQARDEAARPFDLAQAPLARFRLWRLAADEHVFLVNLHHIISDGRSIAVFTGELAAWYAEHLGGPKADLPVLPIQYADFAASQREWLSGPALRPQLAYWQRQLQGLPPLLELPTDRPRPPQLTYAGATLPCVFEAGLAGRLRQLARQQGTTPFVALVSLIAVFLGRHTRREDVPIACPASQRGHLELEALIGFFVNTLVLRIDLSGKPSFIDLLARAKATAADGFANQDVPFDQVVDALAVERNPSYPPLAQFSTMLLDAGDSLPKLAGLDTAPFDFDNPIARYDLTLEIYAADDALNLFWIYNTALFDAATVARMARHLRNLAEAALAEPQRPLAELSMLDEDERHALLRGFNATAADYPSHKTVVDWFEEQAARAPDVVALACADRRMDYAELNAQANRLARHLTALGVAPDTRVAVCVGRGPDMVVGLLAILKAGGAYVPLDPSYPPERLAYMLEDSAPVAVLADAGTRTLLAGLASPVRRIDLDADQALWAGQSDVNAGCPHPRHLAYVIYTSGSTGWPKGVMIEHVALVNHIAWQSSTFHFSADDAFLQRTATSFDASVWEIWTPLAIGARLVLVPDEDAKDPGAIARIIRANRVTVAQFVPSFLRLLAQHPDAAGLPCRHIFCGGEALTPDLVEQSCRVFPAQLVNLYGPTEATIDATAWACPDKGPLQRVPIGRPIANTQTYLLDAQGQPVPVGVVGEIHIGGAGLARGYLNRPELTAERFVADPFAAGAGARLYKTGDLGRWLADGTIEFLGRADFQVKLRGFRIELGEIEDRLSRMPGVKQAVAALRETAGGKSLVAYVVADTGWDANAARDWLKQALPDYMLPHFFVALDRLPLTPNGKLDRNALPTPEPVRAEPSQDRPRNPAEQALAAIWAQLLGLDHVGIHDNFFALGGDSILSIQAASRASQAGWILRPKQFFEHQTIATLAAAATPATPSTPAQAVDAPPSFDLPPQAMRALDQANVEDAYPLTPLQQGLLFHSLYQPGTGLYCVQLSLLIHGLDSAAFKQAWQCVLAHHPALRTAFFWEGLEQALQIVQRQVSLPWLELDWRDFSAAEQATRWQDLIEADQRQGFDLSHAPLLRITLARVAGHSHRLLWSHHHLLLDGWSSSLVVKDLLAAYHAFRRGATPALTAARPYREYVAWLNRQDQAQAEAFWRETLHMQDAPTPLPLAPLLPGQTVAAEHCAEQVSALEPALTGALQALAKQCQVPLNTVVQAAFALLLNRYSGADAVLFGVTTSGRPADLAGVEAMVGLFINTLPLRVEVPPEARLKAWLKTVQQRQVDAQQYDYASLAQIQAWSGVGGGVPLFDALYVFENYPLSQAVGDNADALRIDDIRSFDWTNYPLTLAVVPGPSLRFILLHDTRRIGAAAARRMLAHLRQVLAGMAKDAEQPLSRLSLLTDDERRRALIEWNDTARPYPRDSNIPALFDAAAAQTPQALALSWGAQQFSYAQLQGRANQIAQYLNAQGVTTGALVALHLPRSAEMVALLLGILKAGAAYVPLDTAYPAERLALMLRDSGAKLLLTERGLAAGLGETDVPVVFVDDLDRLMQDRPTTAPAVPIAPDSLAYVIYTSGSTGTPKGVAVAHRAIIRLVRNTDFAQLGPQDRVAQASNASFDAATFEIWGALLNGSALVGIERDVVLSPWRLAEALRDGHISTLFLTTALFNQIAREAPAAFQPSTHLLFGGEAVDPGAVAEILRHGGPKRLLHVYGPTENTTFSTWQLLTDVPDGAATLPIGKPIANSTLYLLDRLGEPVPVGVPGELYVGGDGLAQGYWRQPSLTDERFVANPFSGQPGAKLYRTGDIARYLDDGSVEFIGRADNQVKIRGFRVELGEIEAALAAHPAVREAVVNYAGRRLVAYLVLAPDARVEVKDLKLHLAQKLPDYMLPSAFVTLEQMPLNANGKIDRKRLPQPTHDPSAERAAAAAKTPVEEIIAGIWAKVLDRAEVGIDDDFFDLGGHSLLATQVISRLREAFGVELPLSLLFQSPTVAALARAVDAARLESACAPETIPRIGRDGALALSFAQERLWFLDQLAPGNPFYNVPLALRLRGELDSAALERAIAGLVARHEVLRTRFPAVDGRPVQAIADSMALTLPVTDLTTDAQEATQLMVEEARTPFNLAAGPLLRPRLLRLQADVHILLFTMHHIIADGWSLGVLVNELVPLYAAELSSGVASGLPALPIQYADFAAWQRAWLVGPVLESQLAYWRQQLAGVAPTLELPTDRPRPPTQSYQGSSVHFQIDADTAAAFRRLSRDHGATLFMALLSAFATLLYRYSGRDDIVIGSPIANRTRVEIEPLIGFFVNTLAMRVDLRGNPRFVDLLGRVRKTALEAYAHQDLPFEKLVDEIQPERDLSLNPLFQVMFALQNAPLKRLELPGLEAELLENKHLAALFDLVLDIWETDAGLAGVLEYNSDLFDEATVQRIVGHFSTLLASIAANPDSPVDDLAWLTASERQWLLQTGDGPRRDYPVHQTIHALFERTAAHYPANIAATHRGVSISYAGLEARANRIAQHLRRHDVGPGDFVGILDERGIDVLAAMLAVLKAGAAFVPFDPAYPAERIQHMLADSQVKVLISRSARLTGLPVEASLGYVLLLDGEAWANEPVTPPVPLACGTDLAYMLYTSGSTGLPKGAMLRHDGAVNHIFAEFELLGFHANTAFLQSAPSSSDISVWQFLAPVLIGGRTVIADYETVCDPAALLRLIQSERVSVIELVPVVLRALLDHATTLSADARALPDLAWAMVTGEAATPALVNLWLKTYPSIKLVNAYGPTEAADDISQAVLDRPLDSNRRSVPIGLPLPNLSLYVLDKDLRLVPAGVPGEICVSGIGVGAGYFGQPQKTRESFVPNPFADGGRGEVLYRTGDLGRWLPDGTLECLERIDHQIKLRGFRIELGEIEGVLGSHPAVREAAVVIRDDLAGEKQLLGYVVPDTDAADVRALADALRREQVNLWQDLHEDSYQDELLRGDATFNVIGWDSNYTNAPLPEADMREYVGFTVDRINSLHPGRVLELGCGTGLIMFPLLPHCAAYTGTDLSQVTIGRLQTLRQSSELQSRIPNLTDARLLHKRADDCEWMEQAAFDTVVLASVVQYFPGIDYLLDVLDGVFGKALAAGGSVFIGDVRSLPLLQAFTASVQLYKAKDEDLVADLAEKTRLHLAQEQEMAIDPGFFVALRQRYPQISAVDILPKRGVHHNEMTRFRYDVLIRTAARPSAPDTAWIDWREARPGLDALRQRLAERPAMIAWHRVQNLRVRQDVAAAEWLLQGSHHKTVGELSAALAALPASGLEPEDLWRLGEETGYQVDLSFAVGHADGSFAAVFRPQTDDLPPAPLPPGAEAEPKPWRRYANNPLHEKLARQLMPLLRDFLKEKLPHYMVPAHYVLLPSLPLTPAGKVDRLALPAPALAARVSGHEQTAPRNLEEQVLAAAWADVLGLEQVGVHDNFFELGGHSLKATQVVSRIHRDLDVSLALREIFNHPTIAELADCVRAAKRELYAAIPTAPDAPDYPLSHAQRRLWVLSQMQGGSAAYNMPLALLLEGPVDVAALQGALDGLAARHESLRTAFILVDDTPRQWIAPQIQVRLARLDLTGNAQQVSSPFGVREPAGVFAVNPSPLAPLPQGEGIGLSQAEATARRLALEDAQTPFDLSQAGLFRASLLKLAEDRHVLLFNMHHIISDGWSMGVLVREFTYRYAALARGEVPDLPPLTVQYRDYACWQEAYLRSDAAASARGYWHRKLAGTLPVLNLATDKLRPPVKTYRGGNVGFRLGGEQTAGLAALGRAHHASLFMVLAALVKTLLYRHTGQVDVLVGFPIAGRDHADLESQIGFYVNTLPLRDTLDGDAPFAALLDQVKATATEAYGHQAYPFDRLVDELDVPRDVSRSPMFDVVIVMQNTDESNAGMAGLRIRPFVTEYAASKFDLSFTFEERDGGLQVDIGYNTDLFIQPRIERFAGHFAELADSVLADASTPLDRLNLLPAAERKQVLGEAPVVYTPENTLVGLFEAQVAKTLDNAALVFPETAAEISPQEAGPRQVLNYAELNARANRLARHLKALGAGLDNRVGLCLPRGLDLAVALLGILKAGAAYVPLDPTHPAERRAFMAEDAGLTLLLTVSDLGLEWPGLSLPIVNIDEAADAIAQHSVDNPPAAATPDSLAYVIYTSGSTGQPKGVAVTHHNVVRLFAATADLYRFNAEDVWTLFHSAAFDFSVWEFWGALLYGGSLVIVPYWVSRSPQAFRQLLARERVTVLNQTPSAFRQLIQADADAPADEGLCLRHVIFGGEALDPRSLKPWFDRHGDQTPRLVNMYGITETTVHVTYRPLSAADLDAPGSLIGKPLADLRLYLLDPRQQPVAIGVTGELYVGGGGVTRGYLNRPELTGERFIADPFGDGKLYRSGDLARFLPNGDIEYLGRIDHQVQIRGFRVELGEIEAALCRHDAVREAIVIADETRLVAYLTPTPAPAVSVLRQHLSGLLPDYMLPATFIALDAFPLTGNGKLDRAALPKPEARPSDAGTVYVPAEAGLEKTIAEVFMRVLDSGRVGLHDNFFELGANSLLLMQAHRKLQQALGRDFPVVLLFQHPTVAALAAHLGERPGADTTDTLTVAQDRAAKQKAALRKRKTL